MYATHDNGASWNRLDINSNVTLHATAFQDANRGLIVGDDGTILATEDGGKTWNPRTSGTKEHLLSIYTVGDQAWAGGFDGVLLHSGDGGKTWQPQASGTTMALESIFFLNPTVGWAVGWSGTILRTEDGGKTWDPIKTDAASWSLAAVRFVDEKHGWATGFSGQLIHSSDGGKTWETQQSGSNSWLTSIAIDKSEAVVGCGRRAVSSSATTWARRGIQWIPTATTS